MNISTVFAGFLALLQVASPISEKAPERIIPVKAPQEYRVHRSITPRTLPVKQAPASTIQDSPAPIRAFDDEHYAAQLDTFVPYLYVQNTPAEASHCKSQVYRTFQALPASHSTKLQNLDLTFDKNARRGLTSATTMRLRCVNVTDSVLASVQVHEVGHLVDLGQFIGTSNAGKSEFKDFGRPIYNNDLSLDFYRISWLNEFTMKPGTAPLDFVSGYAASDPFEDFAEAYNWYVLQGANFRALASNNEILRQKYEFMKRYVFNEKEFDGKVTIFDSFKRVYDSTLLGYSLRSFLDNASNSF